jgi:hypothetical protein
MKIAEKLTSSCSVSLLSQPPRMASPESKGIVINYLGYIYVGFVGKKGV